MIGTTTEIERILVRIVADATSYDRVMDRVVGRMTQTAARLTAAGRRLTMGFTAPLLAMATISVASAGKFEYSAARIQGAANMTTAQITQTKDSVLELARELGMRPTALIDTFEELTKGGADLAQILAGSGKVSAMLAKVGGVDNSVAAKTMVKILNVFHRDNLTAAQAANTLSAAADASVISIEDMIHSISQGSSMAAQAQQSFTDFATSIGLLGQAGIVSRDAGTSLKTFFMSLFSGERQKYFEKYGLSAKTATGQIKPLRNIIADLDKILAKMSPSMQLRAVSEMFGSDAARSAITLANAGAEGFDKLKAKMVGATTVEEKYNLLLQTFNGQMERLLGLIENIGIGIGGRLVPYIQAFGDSIESAIKWWEGLNAAQKNFLFGLAMYAALAGPALILMGRMIGLVQVLSGRFWILSSAAYRGFTSLRGFLLGLPRLLMNVAPVAMLFGRRFVLSMGAGMAGMSRYFVASLGALWRVAAIAIRPLVSLFAPFVMDIVYIVGGIGWTIVKQFAFLPRVILPVFAALWRAAAAFGMALPGVFAAFRTAMFAFVAAIPGVLASLQTAANVFMPWAVALSQAVLRLTATTLAPILGMLATTITTALASIAAGIGSVVATMVAVAAFPVIVIGGIIAIVEAIRYMLGSISEMDRGFKITGQSALNFFKAIAGFIANLGENWDRFVTWFGANWTNMFWDALKAMGIFLMNMGNNTLAFLGLALGSAGIYVTEFVVYLGDAFAHGWDVVSAWIKDTLVAFKDWSVRVGTMIWDALTGGNAYQEVLQAQANKVTYGSQVGAFKSDTFGKEFDNSMADFTESVFQYVRTPFQGFESSMSPLPTFETDSKAVDELFANGLGFFNPQIPEMKIPDMAPKNSDQEWIQNLLKQINQPKGLMQIPDVMPKLPKESGHEQGPGDTFKQISLRRFAVEGKGGLARPTDKQQKDKYVDNQGITSRLDQIKQAILLSKGIIR